MNSKESGNESRLVILLELKQIFFNPLGKFFNSTKLFEFADNSSKPLGKFDNV